MSKVITRLLCLTIIIKILSCQTYFNYVANGNFQNNTCTSSQLSYQYNCLLSLDSYSSWTSDYSDGYAIDLEYGYNYYYTSSSSIVASLDSYHYDAYHYHPSSIVSMMHPITPGSYRLTFTAYTRKTGSASDYYFYVSVFDANSNYYLNNKTYQFSYLGTMSIT